MRILLLVVLLFAGPASAVTITHTFSNTTPAEAPEVNTNFGDLKTWLESCLTNEVIAGGTTGPTPACLDPITETELASISALEAQVGSVNILIDTELDTTAKLLSIITDEGGAATALFGDGTWVDVIKEAEMDTLAEWDTQIGLTGTPDATNFLRGDGAWTVPSGAMAETAGVIHSSTDPATDDLAVGGTTSAANFFVDGATGDVNTLGDLTVAGTITVECNPATEECKLDLDEETSPPSDPGANLATMVIRSTGALEWFSNALGVVVSAFTDRDNEFAGLTEKVTPVSADLLILEDSAASGAKRRVQVGNLPTGGGEANTHSSDGGGLSLVAATPKVGIDLRLASMAAADFNLAADAITIDDVKWAKDSELHANRNEEGFFILDGVLTAGEEVLVKANGSLTLVQLDCTALGGATPTVTYTVVECASGGGSCVSSGLVAALTALGTNVSDSTPTDADIDDGDWWGLEATTLTTEPNTVNCTVEFTRND